METTKICLMLMVCVCGLLALSQVTKAEGECEYNGKTYKSGKGFKEGGKCRSCKCKDGAITCKTKSKCKNVCKSVECVEPSCKEKVIQEDLCCPLCAPDTGSCDYNGLEYEDGDTFTSIDGCNTCRCRKGEVDCTDKKCKDCKIEGMGKIPSGTVFPGYKDCDICACQNGDAVCRSIECPSCLYNGTEYEHEEEFRHMDGCNRCQCLHGKVECTDFDCPDDCVINGTMMIKDGQSFPSKDGYNQCWCMDGEIECTDLNCTLPGNSSCIANGTVFQSGKLFLDESFDFCMCMYGEVECSREYTCGNATDFLGREVDEGVFQVPSFEDNKNCDCRNGTLWCNV